MSDVDTGGPVVVPDDAEQEADPNAENTEPLSGGDVATLREQAQSAMDEGQGGGAGVFPWSDPDRPENAEAMGGAGFRDVRMPAAAAFAAPDGRQITSDQPLAVDTSGPAPVLVPSRSQADVAAGRSADPGGSVVLNEADLNARGRGIPTGAEVGPRGTLDAESTDVTDEPAAAGDEVDDLDQYHKGGGWYELPNGQTVQGKDAAREALSE